ncbi:MAG: hypothetical protein OXH31_07160 [Gammaproteobacteria bacterium]|nr:hypothetical protein [Gammaproteobacteria bacterium]
MTKRTFIGLLAYTVFSVSVIAQSTDFKPMLVHYERFEVRPEQEPFLKISDIQVEAWNRLVEQCTPIDTRDSLSESCLLFAEQYFSNEPVWVYHRMYYYDNYDGWVPVFIRRFGQRDDHSHADFLDSNVPLWRDIFDGQIEQRQKTFLQVVSDESCMDLANANTLGIHETKAEHCKARELFKYASYLNACNDAQQRMDFLQQTFPEGTELSGLNQYEVSFQSLDKWVSDEALRSSAKRRMEKGYLQAYWVAEKCKQHGYEFLPRLANDDFKKRVEMSARMLRRDKDFVMRNITHDHVLRIAAKSGDDWAIRSFPLGSSTSEFNQDIMKKYPLLMHRTLGKGTGYDFTWQEEARHRAKAYLLLVEQSGEKLARLEYDPTKLTEEIQYVKDGGKLRPPPSRAEVLEEANKWLQEYEEDELLKEMKGELF